MRPVDLERLGELMEPGETPTQAVRRVLEWAWLMRGSGKVERVSRGVTAAVDHASLFDLLAQRAAEKQASRDADAQALASGEKTREQLCAENDMFHGAASITLCKPRRRW